MSKTLWVLLAMGGTLLYSAGHQPAVDPGVRVPLMPISSENSGLETASGPAIVPTEEAPEVVTVVPEGIQGDRTVWANSMLDEMTSELRGAKADLRDAYAVLRQRQSELEAARRKLDWARAQRDAVADELNKTLNRLSELRAHPGSGTDEDIAALQQGLDSGLRPALIAADKTADESAEAFGDAQQAVVRAHDWIGECRTAVSDSELAVDIANQQIQYLQDTTAVAAKRIGSST